MVVLADLSVVLALAALAPNDSAALLVGIVSAMPYLCSAASSFAAYASLIAYHFAIHVIHSVGRLAPISRLGLCTLRRRKRLP